MFYSWTAALKLYVAEGGKWHILMNIKTTHNLKNELGINQFYAIVAILT